MAGIRYVQAVVVLLGFDGSHSVFDFADSIYVLLDSKVNIRIANKKTSNEFDVFLFINICTGCKGRIIKRCEQAPLKPGRLTLVLPH